MGPNLVCGNDFTTSPTKTTKTSTLGPCRNLGSRSRIIRLLYSERAISLSDADCKEVEVCRPPWIESRDRMRCEDILVSSMKVEDIDIEAATIPQLNSRQK